MTFVWNGACTRHSKNHLIIETSSPQAVSSAKRLARYLSRKPRLVYCQRRQELSAIDVYVDTDWAKCARTRKFTSGGAIMLGAHMLKH